MLHPSKFLALLLCLALALTMAAVPAGAEAELVTIDLYRPNMVSADQTAVAAVEEAINAYIGEKIGVQVKIHELDAMSYIEKLNLELASDGDVDLFFTANWLDTIGTADLVRNNAVYDLTEVLPSYPELYSSMPAVFWEGSRYSGKDYFVPVYKDIVSSYSIITHPEYEADMGLDMSAITQLSDLTPYLAQAQEKGVSYPFLWQNEKLFDYFDLDKHYSITPFAGVPTSGDTAKIINLVETPEYMDYCKLMYSWANAGYINEAEATKSASADAYLGGDFGFTWITTSVDGKYGTTFGWEPASKQLTKSWVKTGATLGACYGVSVKTDKLDACMKFLQLLMTDTKLADTYTFGVEGVNFTYTADGKVQYMEGNTYTHWPWESTSLKAVSLTVDQADDYTAQLEAFNNSGEAVPCMGFNFDSTPVSAEYATVCSVVDEYAYLLETGFTDPETGIPAYLNALKEAGVETVITEMQRQYDEWLATK